MKTLGELENLVEQSSDAENPQAYKLDERFVKKTFKSPETQKFFLESEIVSIKPVSTEDKNQEDDTAADEIETDTLSRALSSSTSST